jgi:hypothetical protein
MVWGKQYRAREYFDITKPHIVWAYVPHQMVDGTGSGGSASSDCIVCDLGGYRLGIRVAMSRYVFDIETNGFLDQLDRVHCLVLKDIDTERSSMLSRAPDCRVLSIGWPRY